MPKINEWVIPKNIDKPFETVYEIKNEYDVPSFEEFMKTYEVDEKVNYSDLESSDVGSSKGYGPCIINNQVVINANCRCSREEINAQIEFVRRHSLGRRFEAKFTLSGSFSGFFATDSPNFLDIDGDTVEWKKKSDWELALIGMGLLINPAKALGSLAIPNPSYRTSCITIRNIEQLKRLLQAFENHIIIIFMGFDIINEEKIERIKGLIERHERGENISGNYEL